MSPQPTMDQLNYAAGLIRRRRAAVIAALVTGYHVERVAAMVVPYCGEDFDDAPTAGEVAEQILRWVADQIEPLMDAGS